MAVTWLLGEKCARCGNERTKEQVDGIPTCPECALKLRADREDQRTCPACHIEMDKLVILNVIVDKCSQCHGAWLDGGELELLRAGAEEEADDGGGFFPGFMLGMVVG